MSLVQCIQLKENGHLELTEECFVLEIKSILEIEEGSKGFVF